MDQRTALKVVERLQALERTMPAIRLGVITDTTPLSVALGGSDVSYTDVKALAGSALAVDDVVSVVRFGADLVILGKLGDGSSGTEIGYDEITTPVTVSSGTESAGTTIITCGAHTFDGNPVVCEFFAPYVDVLADLCIISLFEGSTQISRLAQVRSVTAGVEIYIPVAARLRFTPAAGSHTYKITGHRTTNNAVVGAGNRGTGGSPPAFVRFTKA